MKRMWKTAAAAVLLLAALCGACQAAGQEDVLSAQSQALDLDGWRTRRGSICQTWTWSRG